MSRINEPTVIPGICWMSNRNIHTGGRNYGFHDARDDAAIRKSSEIFASSVRFKMCITANENIPLVHAKVYVIEYAPSATNNATFRLAYDQIIGATAPQQQAQRFWCCKSTNTEVKDLWVGCDGVGDVTDHPSSDGRHHEFNRLRDTINTETKSKYKVLREFQVVLEQPSNRGPDTAVQLRQQHAIYDGPPAEINEEGSISKSNVGLARGDAAYPEYDQTKEGTISSGTPGAEGYIPATGRGGPSQDLICFDGPRAVSRSLEFTVPYKRKLTYDDNILTGHGSHSVDGTPGSFGHDIRALFPAEEQMIPEFSDLLVVVVAGNPSFVPPHVDPSNVSSGNTVGSGKSLPLVRMDYTSELQFRDT